jgi:hypothetical protein
MGNEFPSRRDFLKLGGAVSLSILLAGLGYRNGRAASFPGQGRVLYRSLIVRDTPAFSGTRLKSYPRDSLLDISDQEFGGVDGDYNRTWYRLTSEGYVYSGGIQLVSTILNQIAPSIPDQGILGEITVPYADSIWALNRTPVPGPRLYQGSTHWIKALVTDQRDGSQWYKVYDNLYNSHYYTRPEWMHLFSKEEISPISSQVPENEKHIEINLDRQLLMSFEWNVPVYAARISTGQKNYETPIGWFRTFHKRPTYHMTGGADITSVFDLPGVPWDSYITDNGIAIHGTYWHNDFGHPHSHGCINMAIQDAQWIYRWTVPTVPPEERLVLEQGTGTRVHIVRS